jgi:hypothetical protein
MKEVSKKKKYKLCNGNNDSDLGTYKMNVTNKDTDQVSNDRNIKGEVKLD